MAFLLAGTNLTSSPRTACQSRISKHVLPGVIQQPYSGICCDWSGSARPLAELRHERVSTCPHRSSWASASRASKHGSTLRSTACSSTNGIPQQQQQELQQAEPLQLEQLLANIKLTADEQAYIMSRLPEDLDWDALCTVIHGNIKHLQQHRFKPASLILREPRLLITPLPEWYTFFQAYGFTEDQWQHILWEAPESLANATLVSAGQTMLVLKGLGLDEYGIKQMCVFYPQLLSMEESEVKGLVRLVAKHNSTHGFE